MDKKELPLKVLVCQVISQSTVVSDINWIETMNYNKDN